MTSSLFHTALPFLARPLLTAAFSLHRLERRKGGGRGGRFGFRGGGGGSSGSDGSDCRNSSDQKCSQKLLPWAIAVIILAVIMVALSALIYYIRKKKKDAEREKMANGTR